MGFEVEILADSTTETGARLITKKVRYPRPIHSEIMTHRALTKSSASSRAIPTEKLIAMIEADPWIPMYIGKNQRGMQAGEELSEGDRAQAERLWKEARNYSIYRARELLKLGVHKQVINRLLEPWMWITVIISGTEWDNFYGLRDHELAEPHFQHLARMMRAARDASTPKLLKPGEWHLPMWAENYGQPDDEAALMWFWETPGVRKMFASIDFVRAAISAARCARVSYLTQDGKRDFEADVQLYARLVGAAPKHAAPTEHAAMALGWPEWFAPQVHQTTANLAEFRARHIELVRSPIYARDTNAYEYQRLSMLMAEMQSGNYIGFKQLRKFLPNENIGGLAL